MADRLIATGVHPSKIESTLLEQWQSLEGTHKVKAALFNLLVYVEDPGRVEYALGICQLLIKQFPSRVILMVADPALDDVQVEVGVEPIGEQPERVSCDLIAMRYPPAERERVALIALPHLLPGLPTYAFWMGEPATSGDFFPYLESYISKVIFDPDSLQGLAPFFQRLLQLVAHFPGEIIDLRWANGEGWRNVMASTYNSPEKIEELRDTKDLVITYAYREGEAQREPRIQSLYFQAWIADKMGWRMKSLRQAVEETRIDYEGRVSVVLRPRPSIQSKSHGGSPSSSPTTEFA